MFYKLLFRSFKPLKTTKITVGKDFFLLFNYIELRISTYVCL